jgi:multidrug efflux pump subunit AcrB
VAITAQVQDRTDQGNEALDRVMGEIQAKAAKTPELTAVFSNLNIRVPQLEAHVDPGPSLGQDPVSPAV